MLPSDICACSHWNRRNRSFGASNLGSDGNERTPGWCPVRGPVSEIPIPELGNSALIDSFGPSANENCQARYVIGLDPILTNAPYDGARSGGPFRVSQSESSEIHDNEFGSPANENCPDGNFIGWGPIEMNAPYACARFGGGFGAFRAHKLGVEFMKTSNAGFSLDDAY